MAEDLKNTLNLPQTAFSMKANLVQREPERISHWEAIDLYSEIQKKNAKNEAFILHDGPPFTNGDVHVGTALNKILKDFVLRYKSMRGYRTPYVPGWDCHGLPIEHKVIKSNQDLTPAQIRKACMEFSESFIKIQSNQFRRLGILTDWSKAYKTMDPAYEADILRTFAQFVELGLVYRSKKPVYWSIPCKTALAEGEVEYKDIENSSIWAKFKFKKGLNYQPSAGKELFFVIWTTTPWTLPGNLAVAVHPDLNYVEIEHGNELYLVAEPLAARFVEETGLHNTRVHNKHLGKNLENWELQHPFLERTSLVVLGDYITTDTGTGCVHTAPGHGLEDYFTGIKYCLDILCVVNDQGSLIDALWMPEELKGAPILSKEAGKSANDRVIALLKKENKLLHVSKITHSYPHCWRSKTPLIFRATDQWFVSVDHHNLRDKVLESIGKVKWIPARGENRIRGAIEARPDWCISRQRAWGMPLPVFYNKEGEAFLDAGVINQLANKFERFGGDIWYTQTAQELLEGLTLPDAWKSQTLTPGTDTMDVWIDSGTSHIAVLRKNLELKWPADIYLEGSDQHRGWFQSSLWTSVACFEKAPYKAVVTHGFVVDENRKKISKSGDKPQTAESYVNQYGCDIVRLWVSSADYQNDIPLSEGIFQQVSQTYRTIRNTLRFQLGNLYDFNFERDGIQPGQLLPIDQWVLKKTHDLIQETAQAYDAFEFHKVYQAVNLFCTTTLSATYHDTLKDRLYTYAYNWTERRSGQTAICIVLQALLRILAPILSFTTDEAFCLASSNQESIHLQDWPKLNLDYYDATTVEEIDHLLALKSALHEKMEAVRQAKLIGSSIDAQVKISGTNQDPTFQTLEKFCSYLPELFIVSSVELIESTSTKKGVTFEVSPATGERCPRSWRWVPELVFVEGYGRVSPRCRDALLAKLQTPNS